MQILVSRRCDGVNMASENNTVEDDVSRREFLNLFPLNKSS